MHTIIEQAHDYTSKLLEKCKDYPYHNPAHTASVFGRATYLAMAEGVEGEDLEDIQIAALFHDTGFTEQYEKNEYFGARIARTWLEWQKYEESRIVKIEGIVMATVLFSKPKSHLEEIIQDADLDNIGTKEEFFYSQNYLREIRTIGHVDIPDCAYWQFVYTLLTKYKFHTKTAKKERHDQQARDVEHMGKYLSMIGCEIPSTEWSNMHHVS